MNSSANAPMKNYLRFDSVGGASGDMILSALTALGADLSAVERQIAAFFPEPVHFHRENAEQYGITGLRVTVHSHHHHHEEEWTEPGHHHHHEHHHCEPEEHHHHHHEHRSWGEIRDLLTGSPLPAPVKEQSLAVFREIAEAEAAIHGRNVDEVHFHEVGAWDSVADIVGCCLALHQLQISGVACGPLPSGTGTIRCAHGEMPNPAPATQTLLAGMKVVQTDEPFELVTPTAAALLRVWIRQPVPVAATVAANGIGFGSRELNGRPNLLRATLLRESGGGESTLLVMETNIDDANPEWLPVLMDKLIAAGARDVWCTPVLMKKGRPATCLSVLADRELCPSLRETIFKNSTTFGIRFYPVEREILNRRFVSATTPWGEVTVKIGERNGETVTIAPEFESCRKVAEAAGVTLPQVYRAATANIADRD